jgi:hypothetical protein
MNPNRKMLAIILATVGLICVTLEAMGVTPKFKLHYNIIEVICFTCFLFFCLEKNKPSN